MDDPGRLLEQILANLVDNAIAYARPQVPPAVRVAAVRNGLRVRVSVKDNGSGIPPDLQERIFDVFTRASAEQEAGHAGIGLATVRRAARAMDVEVHVASEVGVGSEFWLVLPHASVPPGAS